MAPDTGGTAERGAAAMAACQPLRACAVGTLRLHVSKNLAERQVLGDRRTPHEITYAPPPSLSNASRR